MQIRSARHYDAAAIASLYVRTRREAYAAFFPAAYLAAMSVDSHTAEWDGRLSSDEQDMHTYVAESDNGLAGFTRCGLRERCAVQAEIEFMYVAPEHWRSGLGTRLMDHAVEALRSQGATRAALTVYSENHRARAFYEHCGWTQTGSEQEVEKGGAMIKLWWYEYSLI